MMDERDLTEKDYAAGEEVKKRRRNRKTIGEEGSRKQIAIGLIITIILSLLFYLPGEMKGWWKDLKIDFDWGGGEQLITIEKAGKKTDIGDQQEAREAIDQLLVEQAGEYGVYVKNLEVDEGSAIKADQQFTAASVIKLPVLVVYYQAVDSGKVDPQEIYVLQEKDYWEYGTGSLQHQPAGSEFRYQEISRLVANQSDNMGQEILIKKLGGYQRVQPAVEKLGLTKTDLKENKTTPTDIGGLLVKLYDGKLISQKSRDELFANLTNTLVETRLPAGVPEGIRVVHKFGSEAGVVNDCGIIYSDKPYVLCVLSTGVNDGEAEEILVKISAIVWDWLGKM